MKKQAETITYIKLSEESQMQRYKHNKLIMKLRISRNIYNSFDQHNYQPTQTYKNIQVKVYYYR